MIRDVYPGSQDPESRILIRNNENKAMRASLIKKPTNTAVKAKCIDEKLTDKAAKKYAQEESPQIRRGKQNVQIKSPQIRL